MEINKRLKTPLRWPGGKSRAIYKLHKEMGDITDIREIRDAFLGGGSYPLYLSQLYPEKNVWVNDIYFPLYNFWKQLRDNCKQLKTELLKLIKEHFTIFSRKLLFTDMKKVMNDEEETLLNRAVAFYIVNKCSFSGLTEIGSFSGGSSVTNFKESIIKSLPYYSKIIKNWKITNLDYTKIMDNASHVFIYLDPPYDIKSNLYGNKGKLHKHFNHDNFKQVLLKHPESKILVSYNKEIEGLNNITFPLTYTMRSTKKYNENQKKRHEIICKNY
jgi:DNA adenine methylase